MKQRGSLVQPPRDITISSAQLGSQNGPKRLRELSKTRLNRKTPGTRPEGLSVLECRAALWSRHGGCFDRGGADTDHLFGVRQAWVHAKHSFDIFAVVDPRVVRRVEPDRADVGGIAARVVLESPEIEKDLRGTVGNRTPPPRST